MEGLGAGTWGLEGEAVCPLWCKADLTNSPLQIRTNAASFLAAPAPCCHDRHPSVMDPDAQGPEWCWVL